MATKARKNIASKKKGFEFKPWMAFVAIALVVIAGYTIVRFSQAASKSNHSPQAHDNVRADFEKCSAMSGGGTMPTLNLGADNDCVRYVRQFFDDVVGDPTAEEGPMDIGLAQKVTDFQKAINSAFVLATAGYPVPATIDEAKLNELAGKGFIKSPLDARSGKAVDTDGVVGPMTWGWINTITYVYLLSPTT